MYFDTITLRNFRKLKNLNKTFNPQFNIFIGKNAQGKTNIVESLGLFAFGKSFRSSDFRDMIAWGSDGSDIFAKTISTIGEDDFKVSIDLARKTFFRNSKKTVAGGFKGIHAVIFAPEEIVMLRDSPAARRKYIDNIISQVDPSFKSISKNYDKVVSHRNRLLQEAVVNSGRCCEMRAWNEQLMDLGAKVIKVRSSWCSKINDKIPKIYSDISPRDGKAQFKYKPYCCNETITASEEEIKKIIEKMLFLRSDDELKRGVTLVGPHRDDFEATLNDSPLKNFGSQGQHRTFVLALKIVEIEILKEATGEVPILLLDDVASELDKERSRFFFEYLANAKGQVFVTTTDSNEQLISELPEAQKFIVDNGMIVVA